MVRRCRSVDGSVMEPAIEPRTKSHLAEPVYFAGSTLAFLAQSSQQTTSSLPPTFTLMPASVGRHAVAEVLAKRARAPLARCCFRRNTLRPRACPGRPGKCSRARSPTGSGRARGIPAAARRSSTLVHRNFLALRNQNANCRWHGGKMRTILRRAVHWHANRLNSRSAELSRAGPPISLSVRPHSTQNRGTGA